MLYNANGDFERERKLTIEGGEFDLPIEPYREDWHRDYARVIHSYAFRRLQGKRQLFPYEEADFFRNRLTHSLEVAQIAKSIARRINYTEPLFQEYPIIPEIPEIAGLAHDLGHPPFGHNGEKTLDRLLFNKGSGPAFGYEGNAQTLRILAKLEHRSRLAHPSNIAVDSHGMGSDGRDYRGGLNLTYRTLAAILKYDRVINEDRQENEVAVQKGFYKTEEELVSRIKRAVTGIGDFDAYFEGERKFKTVECSIMDIADDIAYSMFDLEDAFQARFLTPLDLIRVDKSLLDAISKNLSKRGRIFSPQKVYDVLFNFFLIFFSSEENFIKELRRRKEVNLDLSNDTTSGFYSYITATFVEAAEKLVNNGYLRALTISGLIGYFIRKIKVEPFEAYPMLSGVTLESDALEMISVLKVFTFESLTLSAMLRYPEYREHEILETIFRAITRNQGHKLMTDNYQSIYLAFVKHENTGGAQRTIADYISGMTDRYALDVYDRLTTGRFSSIFRP